VFQQNLPELKSSDSYLIAALMTQVDGWERTNDRKKQAFYGRQRLYRRI
jgi:putative DNA primase/helicase